MCDRFSDGSYLGSKIGRCRQPTRMVVREEGLISRKAVETALVKAGDKPQIVMELGSREALREAVVKGIGIGTVSEAGYWPKPRLCMLRLFDTDIRTD